MNVNDILQISAVAVIIAVCVVWLLRRLLRRSKSQGGCCSEEASSAVHCADCPLSKQCTRKQPPFHKK